jgi:acyl-coenzyme A synthetase/AMP-(fatty) acid ligase
MREMLEAAVSRVPDKVLVQYGLQHITYQEFDSQVNRAANMLLNMEIRNGDRVCMYLPNCLEFLYAWFGILKIGAILVPINYAFKKREAQYIINHSEPKALISNNTGLEIIKEIQQETGFPNTLLTIDSDTQGGIIELMNKASDTLQPIALKDDDIAMILYTSGTTGYPKGCMLSQDYYRWIGYRGVDSFALDQESRTLVNMPLFHIEIGRAHV